MLVPRWLPRRWLAVGLASACLGGCAAAGIDDGHETGPPPSSASPPRSEATSVVLLRLRQRLDGAPAAERKGLYPWIANIDRADPMHRVDGDPLPAALAAQGWIAWHLPAGSYQIVIAGYATNGLPPRIVLDRYRFSVPAAGLALYLGSLTYACEPAWWFEALCPDPPMSADDPAEAQPVATALGLPEAASTRFQRVPSTGPRVPGTDPARIPQLEAAETLLMAGEGQSVRTAYDFLAQAQAERAVPAQVGTQMLVQLAPYGPAAIVAVPITALTEAGVAIHRQRLTRKMECLQRIWDDRADALARQVLESELLRAADGAPGDPALQNARTLSVTQARGRYRRLLALNVQRLAIQSCHPSAPWLPDPRGQRFCMEASIRARVYGPDSAEPLSDEVFALVPERRVGHEFEPTGWPIPPGYLYETPLASPVKITRTYDEYCAADGFARVEADLHRLLEAMVPQVLALHGIRPRRSP